VADLARRAAVAAQSPAEVAEARARAVAVDGRMVAGLAAVGEVSPPPGATPADVARWWTALPPDLRGLALARRAAELGRTAGLPAEVRDAANRIELARLLRALRAERARLAGAAIAVPPALRRITLVRSMLAVAEGAARALAEHPGARLLSLDLSGAGRVAIGLGDVDRAANIAVLVPGMGTAAVHGVATTVRRAEQLRQQAGHESVASTAVIAWIGYASPGLRQVGFATRARAGGRSLAADLAALTAGRTVDGGRPAHVTVIGHSYGSTVAGAAARLRPRLADDLVLLGSPGVLAEQAADLGVPPARVYVGEAPLDAVADLGAFGADPGDRDFGATRMRADPGPDASWPGRLAGGDHTHYFDPGSESLRNIARVVVGHGPDVSREGR
jgi:pimeloyl-ACP methyl ester carboxylesterase